MATNPALSDPVARRPDNPEPDHTLPVGSSPDLSAPQEPAATDPRFSGLPASDRSQIDAFRARRRALALHIILNPEKKLSEIAADLGLSQSFVYAAHSSDDFQALLADLAAQHESAVLNDHASKISMLYTVSMEKSIERIHAGNASEGFLTQARQDAMTAKGFLGQKNAGPTDQSIVVNVDARTLIEARENLHRLHSLKEPERKASNVPANPLSDRPDRDALMGSNSGTIPGPRRALESLEPDEPLS